MYDISDRREFFTNMNQDEQDLRWKITSAIGDITRLYHVYTDPQSFKELAYLVCNENTGDWELVELDSRQARRHGVAAGPHVIRVDRADFKETSGGIDELLDLAEVERRQRMEGGFVEGISIWRRRREGMCMVDWSEKGYGTGSHCLLRARSGHLTCELHADCEQAAQVLLAAAKHPRE